MTPDLRLIAFDLGAGSGRTIEGRFAPALPTNSPSLACRWTVLGSNV